MRFRPTVSNLTRRAALLSRSFCILLLICGELRSFRSNAGMLELAEGVQVRRKSIETCLRNKVIPVVWDPEAQPRSFGAG